MIDLLYDEYPIMFSPTLATKIGINESIILQQINYWCKQNEKRNINYKEGYYWTYNSIEKWQKQLPFWSNTTIKRTIKKLENDGYLISGNYNKKGFDRTKWYRINEEKILPLGQIDQMDSVKMTKPIPNNKTNNNKKNKNNAFSSDEDKRENPFIRKFIDCYMNDLYYEKTGKKHPALKKEQYYRVYDTLSMFLYDYDLDYNNSEVYDYLKEMAINHLNSNINTDYNINHFATQGILENRYYKDFY